MRQKTGDIRYIKEELARRLTVMRYSNCSTRTHMRIFDWVQEFLEGYGASEYTKEMGQLFISEYSLQAHHLPVYFRTAKTVIHRLDEIVEDKAFVPRFCEPKPGCPMRFNRVRDAYIKQLREAGSVQSTIVNHKRYVDRILGRLPDSMRSLSELQAKDLYDIFTRHEARACELSILRRFLRFLFDEKLTANDLSACVPRRRAPRTMPSTYTGDEIARVLSSTDRATPIGKRDHAILLLAAKLGIRSSDIVNLSLGDIDRGSRIISIVQVKTGRPLTLVMNDDIAVALDDYIANGRPKSQNGKVFLGSQAPYAPLHAGTGYAIAQRHFDRANIPAMGRRRGTHALRMSYATALVTKGVPYAVVTEALGHDDPEASKYYVRVDIRRLRTCAINVPKPTGELAVNLNDLEGRI
jgi:site-specific recombinase XerD